MWVGGQRHAPVVFPTEMIVVYCIGGWAGTWAVWAGSENVTLPGFDPRNTCRGRGQNVILEIGFREEESLR
jgi:hypothetical protein